MDGRRVALEEKLARLLSEAAEAAVALSRADGTIVGVPHYSQIELAAHELGRQLSRQVQERQMRDLAAVDIPKAACPQCGQRCELIPKKRKLASIDGELEVTELEGRCPFCRRAFFPSTRNAGAGCASTDAHAGAQDHGLRGGDAELPACNPRDARRGGHEGVSEDDRARGARRGRGVGRASRRRPEE